MSESIEIVAHRGASREAPENTLPAFQRALDIGVQGIELDVHMTRDGVPVVRHDPVLSDPPGTPISSLALADLTERIGVPALSDVLQLVNGRCRLYVEIKAAAAVEAVAAMLKTRHDWCAVHSFDHRVAARAAALDAGLATGILLASYLVDTANALRAAGARDVWQRADFVDPELVDCVHAASGRVIAWTVNDLARARELAGFGVDAICTDTPRELLAGLVQ